MQALPRALVAISILTMTTAMFGQSPMASNVTRSQRSTTHSPDHAPIPQNLHDIYNMVQHPSSTPSKGQEGLVEVRVLVDESGNYVTHEVLSEPQQSTSNTEIPNVSEIQFIPATKMGVPVKAWINLPLRFRRRH